MSHRMFGEVYGRLVCMRCATNRGQSPATWVNHYALTTPDGGASTPCCDDCARAEESFEHPTEDDTFLPLVRPYESIAVDDSIALFCTQLHWVAGRLCELYGRKAAA